MRLTGTTREGQLSSTFNRTKYASSGAAIPLAIFAVVELAFLECHAFDNQPAAFNAKDAFDLGIAKRLAIVLIAAVHARCRVDVLAVVYPVVVSGCWRDQEYR